MNLVEFRRWEALDKNVLAVAVVNTPNGEIFDWAAYIGAVPGIDHDKEYMSVAKEGSKLSVELACLLFDYPKEKYRR